LAKLYNEFKDSDFVVLAVDIQEKKEIVKRYVTKKKLPFPVLLDTDGKVARKYGVRAHPAHFFIDGQGKLVGSAIGARDWASDKSRNLIRYLLDQNAKKEGKEAGS
jgi:peroxiredoxin